MPPAAAYVPLPPSKRQLISRRRTVCTRVMLIRFPVLVVVACELLCFFPILLTVLISAKLLLIRCLMCARTAIAFLSL
jgi:hypothetical protein